MLCILVYRCSPCIGLKLLMSVYNHRCPLSVLSVVILECRPESIIDAPTVINLVVVFAHISAQLTRNRLGLVPTEVKIRDVKLAHFFECGVVSIKLSALIKVMSLRGDA